MRALLSTAVGGPETLTLGDLPRPEPKPGEVLIRVAACGLNFPDVLMIEDKYQFKPPRPFAPGAEVSGTVEAVGDGSAGIAAGDRVMALTGHGGLAEYVAAAANRCVPLPDAMPFDEAAAFNMTYGTSYYALKDRGMLRSGETLLVLGAAGGVGIAAVELGKAMGARVVGGVSSEEKAEAVRRAGADEVFVYPREVTDGRALTALYKEVLPKGADVIYDPIGGDHTEPALRSLAWDGRYLVIGFTGGIPRPPLNLTLLKSSSIVGVFWGAAMTRDPELNRRNNMELLELYGEGKVKPLVSERFPLERGGEAIAHLAARAAIGKVVVTLEG